MYIIIKKMAILFFPFRLCLLVMAIGLLLLLVTKRQRLGKLILSTGFVALLLLSFPPLTGFFLRDLEGRYLSPALSNVELSSLRDVQYVVVLGGGHTPNLDLPITSRFSYDQLIRLVEGIRLYRKIPGAKLILSGGAVNGEIPDSRVMADLASELGVPWCDMLLESDSNNTSEEAKLLKPVLKSDRFLLVTSANHMVRAMQLFENSGMHPVAAPTGHMIVQTEGLSSVMPCASSIAAAHTLFYESLALLKENLGVGKKHAH